MKKTYLTILQKSTRLEDVHKEKKVREQDEENKKDGIQIRPEAVWSFPINTLLLCFGQGGKRGKLEGKKMTCKLTQTLCLVSDAKREIQFCKCVDSLIS